MNEEWKDIVNFEGYYQVSNVGRIKSLDRYVNSKIKHNTKVLKKGQIIIPHPNLKGYLQVGLYKNGKRKQISVHRLVAQAFIPNPNNLPEVNHEDGNKENNCVFNLFWATSKENIIHAWRTGLAKSYNHPKGVLTNYSKSLCKQIEQYDLDNNLLNVFNSISEASRQTKCSISTISNCCNGKQHSSKNYIWKFH